ncbi:MAG: hypothetical protein KF832_07500 [Caldilineaceae bacterium]|nr:hypothetical protein [Caldilineaceae bacterium]
MDQLRINLLGGFTVALAQQPVTKFRSAKSRALLAYLAAQPTHEHPRSTLATLLWGDLSESAAKTNLRIELSNLHKVLTDHPALVITRHSVCFHLDQAAVDLIEFQQALTTFGALPAETQRTQLARLTAAVALYQGEFLSGFTVADALPFADWRLVLQEQLHERAMAALTLLQQVYAEQGAWRDLAGIARRQLALVPWQEGAHRNLIQALAAQGQREAALAQYDRCVALLHAELGVEPTLATQEMAARLREQEEPKQTRLPTVARHNLPHQQKSLVGRAAEVAQVYRLIQQEQLVTVLGLGGVGKSRLVQAVGQKALRDFADGVWLIPLAAIEADATAPNRIALAVAAAIGFPVTDLQEPLAEVAAHLADKEILLILDNWDQLTDAAPVLCEQLLVHPGVFILATSRVRLPVEGAVEVALSGLPVEQAVTLFVERARRLVPTFAASEQTAAIRQLCAAVAGLPLGIELAASWMEHFTVAEISQALAQIAVEPAQAHSYVGRHQTLDSLFEYSWRLLSPAQQQILAALSAFRGGFDRAAASAIAHSTLSDLSVLLAHSLVQRIHAGRYDLHPLVQEFTSRKLTALARCELYHTHSAHYLTRLTTITAATERALLRVDFANLRSAWQRAVLDRNDALIAASVSAFGEFMAQFGLMQDNVQIFAEAVSQFEHSPDQLELVAGLLDQQARFQRALHGLRAAAPLHQRVLTLTQNPELQGRSHLDLANHYAEQGEWTQADHHFDQAEASAQVVADLSLYLNVVEERIHVNAIHFRGDFGQGIARLEALLQLIDQTVPPLRDAEEIHFRILQSLPIMAIRHRDYGLAIRYATQALRQAKQLDHGQREYDILLDLALAEQFAGLYPEALAHNQAALALAEAKGDTDQVALLKANLCLTLRQMGELDAALRYGQEAITLLGALGNRRIEGQARNRVGHTLLALARWDEAEVAYGEALVVWESLQHPNRYEAWAGRAVALAALDHPQEARGAVEAVVAFIAQHGFVGIVEPVLLCLNCAEVLTSLGDRDQALELLRQADDWVAMVATRISDEAVRHAFCHNHLYNQVLQQRMRSKKDDTVLSGSAIKVDESG